VISGYAFILPERSRYQLLFMLALFGAYDMSTFLAFAAIQELKISYFKFGPTEFRVALVVINGLLVRYGTRHMISGLKYVNIGAFIGLCVIIYQTHRKVWQIDMARKNGQTKAAPVECDSRDPNSQITVQPARSLYELGSP
jgi:hypothetical protein